MKKAVIFLRLTCAAIVLTIVSCKKNDGDKPSPDPVVVKPTTIAPKILITDWYGFQPSGKEAVVAGTESNDTIAYEMFWMISENSFPSGANVPSTFDSVSLNSRGDSLHCVMGSVDWYFVVDGISSVTSTKITVNVYGLTRLEDVAEYGWDINKMAANSTADDGPELIWTSRVKDPGPSPTPSSLCGSGGVGSTACSTSQGGSGCSVECGGGYYACCNNYSGGQTHCYCVKN